MAQTLQEIFGPGASLADGKLTIDLADLSPYGLDSTKPGAILRATIKRVATIFNTAATSYNDPTVGVTAASFQQGNSFTTRGTETQVLITQSLAFYEPYSNSDDPDNTI